MLIAVFPDFAFLLKSKKKRQLLTEFSYKQVFSYTYRIPFLELENEMNETNLDDKASEAEIKILLTSLAD
jgi:hypothetical protein